MLLPNLFIFAFIALNLVLSVGALASERTEAARALMQAQLEARYGAITQAMEPMADGGARYRFESPAIRADNDAQLWLHDGETEDVVVLLHGLSDSPYFMTAVARDFYDAGADVVIALLPGHGSIEGMPAMRVPALYQAWIATAGETVAVARELAPRVSIGGFSTGGLLSLYTALDRPQEVNGGVFLFSAALDFPRGAKWPGYAAESFYPPFAWLADRSATWLTGFIDDSKWNAVRDCAPVNPYRYRALPRYGAYHLGRLREVTLNLLDRYPLAQPLFVAHSLHDKTAFVRGLEFVLDRRPEGSATAYMPICDVRPGNCIDEPDAAQIDPATKSTCFSWTQADDYDDRAAKACGVRHSSLILAEPITRDGVFFEPANPDYAVLSSEMLAFFDTAVRRDAPYDGSHLQTRCP